MLRAMSVRRLVSVLSVCLVASATVVVAQPKKNDPPVAPAKDAGSATGSAAGSGAEEGSAVQMVEDPPADMEGTSEDPDAPKVGPGSDAVTVAVPEKKKTAGYPIEEVFRPITLPANMSEISFGMNFPVDPFIGTMALRARYGITRQIQLGLTYVVAGIYDDPGTAGTDKIGFHPGKAVGLDVTVLMKEWIGLKIGVPVYIDPVAVALQLGAPMKFRFADGKLALGGLDDLLTIKIKEFPPSLTSEAMNADGAARKDSGSIQSRGSFRISAYAVYQQSPQMALIGRAGITFEDFSGTRSVSGGGSTTFIRAGLQYSAKKFLDVGGSLGWDDLSKLGGFAPSLYLNFRI
jgi:hypothetical protein